MAWLMDSLRDCARTSNARLVFPEVEDARILSAARDLHTQGLARPVLMASPDSLREHARRAGVELPEALFESAIDPAADPRAEAFARILYELRKHKGLTEKEAASQARTPIGFGCLMVRENQADACVAGAVLTTGTVVGTALRVIGVAEGKSTVSSGMMVAFEDESLGERGVFMCSDCAVVTDPTDAQLVDIAASAAWAFRKLTRVEPRVAMLSYSTKGSGKGPSVDKVERATAMLKERYPDLMVDGALQLDAAVTPGVAARKAPESPVAGKANVLVFPDLDAGNIGYKLMQRTGKAEVLGPLLLGLRQPVNDLSRGCTAGEVLRTATATAALCQARC